MDEPGKTIVLRKDDHWYVINSGSGDEKEILLALIEYSEQQVYNIQRGEVDKLITELGWEVQILPDADAA